MLFISDLYLISSSFSSRGAAVGGYPQNEPSSLIAFRNFEEEMKRPGIWESDQSDASISENSRDNLASLYRPPFHLMFNGSFEKVSKGLLSNILFGIVKKFLTNILHSINFE